MKRSSRCLSTAKRLERLVSAGRRALCQFVVAGDPDPETSAMLLREVIDSDVDIVEFCIPFAKSITDGQIIRNACHRALSSGTDLPAALKLMEAVARRKPVVCLADFRMTVRPLGIGRFLDAIREHGAGAVLVHGLPPLYREAFHEACRSKQIEWVGTVYPNSSDATVRTVSEMTGAFLYLVSSYGKSGGRLDPSGLREALSRVRRFHDGPVGVGFGIRTPEDHRLVWEAGADLTISGSALVRLVEESGGDRDLLLRAWRQALRDLIAMRDRVNAAEGLAS